MPQPAIQTKSWPEQLIAHLERQQVLTQRLTELASGQAALIDGGRTDELLTLLGQRQAIVDEFVAGQDELGRLTADLDRRLDQTPAPLRLRIRELLGAIGAALESVMAADGRDQQTLQANCELTRTELASLGAARAAHNAYGSGRPAASRFADQHG